MLADGVHGEGDRPLRSSMEAYDEALRQIREGKIANRDNRPPSSCAEAEGRLSIARVLK
jgi:hypothetical protein